MFTIAGRCVGWWSNDDANWRNEYFSPFMQELGIEVVETTKFADKLKEAVK